jgi:hypothetical protein
MIFSNELPGSLIEIMMRVPERLSKTLVINQPVTVLATLTEFVVVHLPAKNERAAPG